MSAPQLARLLERAQILFEHMQGLHAQACSLVKQHREVSSPSFQGCSMTQQFCWPLLHCMAAAIGHHDQLSAG